MKHSFNLLTIHDYNRLREAVGWSTKDAKQVEIALASDVVDVVVIYKDEVIAMGRVLGDGLYFLIVDVVVHPKYQGRGFGKMVINCLIERIKDSLIDGVQASIQLICGKEKENFYKKLGFHKIAEGISDSCMQQQITK